MSSNIYLYALLCFAPHVKHLYKNQAPPPEGMVDSSLMFFVTVAFVTAVCLKRVLKL